MTTGKTVVLTRWTFVSKVMSLLFNMLSRLVRAFLPRSKHLLISWLQSPSAVILEAKKIKTVTVSIVSPSIWQEVMGLDAVILSLFFFFNLFVFYWRIIALQNFAVFHQTSTWISHRYAYIPSLLKLLPISFPSHPSRLIKSPCLSFLSHTANSHWLSVLHISFHVTLSIHLTLSSPLPMSIILFSMSVSPYSLII